jgi:hypothetical protein
MSEPITLICSSTFVLLALASFAIASKYRGVIKIKFPGAEILIDGRLIQVPVAETKLLIEK